MPRPRSIILLRGAALTFAALAALAMLAYSGGSRFASHQSGYSMGQNVLSDLGATHSWSGASNTISSLIFTVAMTLIGTTLALSAWAWHDHLLRLSGSRGAAAGIFIAVLVSGIGFVGVGFSAEDRAPLAHGTFLSYAWYPMVVFSLLLAVWQWRTKAPSALLASGAAFLIAVLLMLGSPALPIPAGQQWEAAVLLQKLAVTAGLVNLVIQTSGVAWAAPAALAGDATATAA